MRVGELVQKKQPHVVTVPPDATLSDAARLMMRHDIGGLPVVSARGEVVGFLAERDIARAVDRSSGSIQSIEVRRFMHPAARCSPEDDLHEVMGRMTRDRLRHVVVFREDDIAGILSVGDIVKHRLEQLEVETGVLRDYVVAKRAAT